MRGVEIRYLIYGYALTRGGGRRGLTQGYATEDVAVVTWAKLMLSDQYTEIHAALVRQTRTTLDTPDNQITHGKVSTASEVLSTAGDGAGWRDDTRKI